MKIKLFQKWQYQVFLIPALIVYSIFTVFPLIRSFYYSLTNFNGIETAYSFVGFQNYGEIFKDSGIIQAILYTLFFTVSTTILLTLFAIPLALILDSKAKTRNIQRAVFFFASVPSGLLLGYIWGYLMSPSAYGAVNQFLNRWFGIDPVGWLSDPMLAMITTVIVTVWMFTGWHAVIYLAYLQAIPSSLYEAASIDGANYWQKLRKITLPMLAPAMTVSVLFCITGGLKVYEIPFAITKGGPGFSTHSVTQIILLRGMVEMKYGVAMALSMLLFIFILAITIFQLTVMQRREEQLQ